MRSAFLLAIVAGSLPAQSPLPFVEHTLATGLKGGYQTVVADLNRDGRPDIIALASGGLDLVWFENPGPGSGTWERHVLATNLPHTINCAAEDIDGDGIPEIAIAWEFANDAAKSVGKVGVLHHDGDPRQPWKLQEIDELTTSHRIRWADIDGSGHKVAINAALTGSHASPPNYTGDQAPLVLYRPGAWKRETISVANDGVQHGIFIMKWDPKDKRDSILTASFSGLHLLQMGKDGWTRTEIAKGDSSPCPKCGSSDVAVGYLGATKFLAAIEPWHGNQVAIYMQKKNVWERQQIDDSLTDGHTVVTADIFGDGRDAVIAGFRQGTRSVFVYRARTEPGKAPVWEKQILDKGGMGAASCAAADLNADGAVDLICISSTTLKWYENTRLLSPR